MEAPVTFEGEHRLLAAVWRQLYPQHQVPVSYLGKYGDPDDTVDGMPGTRFPADAGDPNTALDDVYVNPNVTPPVLPADPQRAADTGREFAERHAEDLQSLQDYRGAVAAHTQQGAGTVAGSGTAGSGGTNKRI